MGEEKYSRWEQINEVELRAYLGFSILMGINHVPALEDYWKRDPVLRFAPIADRISRGRFRDITRYLHFTDNSTLPPRGSPGHDRLGKVRPVLSHLCQRFAALYDPPRELSVDEAMIKPLLPQAVHADEARQTWDKGVGSRRQCERLLLPA